MVVIQETTKLIASLLLLGNEVGLGRLVSTLNSEIVSRPTSTLRLAVPAVLFFIQNNCIQQSNTYLPAAVFQVTYQGKTFIVALLSVLMLGRRLERFKWLGICFLAVGVALVQTSSSSDSRSREAAAADSSSIELGGDMFLGLMYVVIAACCSGFANVYFEKMVKTAEVTVVVKYLGGRKGY